MKGRARRRPIIARLPPGPPRVCLPAPGLWGDLRQLLSPWRQLHWSSGPRRPCGARRPSSARVELSPCRRSGFPYLKTRSWCASDRNSMSSCRKRREGGFELCADSSFFSVAFGDLLVKSEGKEPAKTPCRWPQNLCGRPEKRRLCRLLIYCLSTPNSPFFDCAVKMHLGLLK